MSTLEGTRMKSEWEEANAYMKWTFSVANPMINEGMKGPHQTIDDLMLLSEDDHSKPLVDRLIIEYNAPKKFYYYFPRLMYSFFKAHSGKLLIVHLFAASEGCTRIASPVIINYLLQALIVPGPSGLANSFKYAGILGILNLVQTGIHHVLFFMSMRMGWQWKTAATGLIFNSLFKLRGINTVGTGKLVNLISNDVSRFEEFAVMAPFGIISMFELAAILIILIFQLNIASAFAGIGMTILFIPIQVYLAKLFAKRRTNTAHQTDLRVRYTSELIDGIATVKSYAWENPFFTLLSELRRLETACIKQSQTLRSVNQGLFYCIPWVAAFSTFSVFWASGGILTLPIVFSTLALLQQLRTSIGRQWTRSIETGSEAVASAIRIQSFLSLAESSNMTSTSPPSFLPLSPQFETIYGNNDSNTIFVSENNHANNYQMKGTTVSDLETCIENHLKVTEEPLVSIHKASFYYPESGSTAAPSSSTSSSPSSSSSACMPCPEPAPVLSDVSLSVKRGELLLIAGPVGAGKSSLLLAILGEMKQSASTSTATATASTDPLSNASAQTEQLCTATATATASATDTFSHSPVSQQSVLPRTAYCAQRPWILAASVRSNVVIAGKSNCILDDKMELSSQNKKDIVYDDVTKTVPRAVRGTQFDFKNPLDIDEPLYALAMESTQVVADLLSWPDYDSTEIGEKGISISGGQKARIALARAVYSDADVVLLDDPLSAVDARVGSLLFFECILSALRGRGKGVVLVTHQLQYMQHADKILALDKNGKQIFYGTYSELQSRDDVFSILSASIDGGDEEEFEQAQGQGRGQGQEVVTTIKDSTDDIPDPVTQPSSSYMPSSHPLPCTLLPSLEAEHSTTLPCPQGTDDITECGVRATTPTVVQSSSLKNSPVLDPLKVPVPVLESPVTRQPTQPALKYEIRLSQRGEAAPAPVKKNAPKQLNLVSVEKSLEGKGKGGVRSNSKTGNISEDKDTDINYSGDDEEGEGEGVDEEGKDGDVPKFVSQIVVAEDRVEGRLSFRIWKQYIMSGGSFTGIWAMSMAVVAQVLLMVTEYWVRWWAGSTFYPERDVKNVWILGILTVLCIFIGFYRAIAWFEFTLAASSNLHERSLWAVLHAPLQFFVANPSGRILNRFTKDQSQADENLPITLFDTLQCILYCVSVLLLICISIPYLIIMMPFLFYLFNYARNKYVVNSIEIKRLEAISRSPIYVDFSSALEGLVTLRGYRLEKAAERSFQQQLDRNSRAWFSFLMVSRWLGFRLDLESSIVLICVVFVAVALRDTIDIGLIGFTIVYTLSLAGLLQWTVRQMAEVETQMTSVERITTYADLPPEKGYSATLNGYHEDRKVVTAVEEIHDINDPSAIISKISNKNEIDKNSERGTNMKDTNSNSNIMNIPNLGSATPLNSANTPCMTKIFGDLLDDKQSTRLGALTINNMTVKYREDYNTPVLKSMSLSIPGGTKVGVIGRTGCGKSSLLLALLRLNIIIEGDVTVDGESILSMDLEHSRRIFSVIPQDPHLFSGTVRFNLDPFAIYSDAEIWAALDSAHIRDCVQNDPLGLCKSVEEGGLNFSVGQRQLLSLSRAILRKSKIVLMDEVTASIDYTTDRLIQKTIRTTKSMKDCTIISVAHRLRTVADSDLVVVMETGGVVGEVGAPLDLLNNPLSLFHQFARETNEFEDILKIASNSMSRSNSGLFAG